jgi:hypothetical protein
MRKHTNISLIITTFITHERYELRVQISGGSYCKNVGVATFIGTVAAVEISDRKDLNTLYKFRNLISVNRIFIKDYKVSVSI